MPGDRLGMNESAVKMAVSRLRKRYGKQIREKIAVTVLEPTQVEEELKALFAPIRSERRVEPQMAPMNADSGKQKNSICG